MGATASALLRRSFIKGGFYLHHSFTSGATVEDNILYSKFPSFLPDLTPFGDKSVVEVLFDVVEEELEKHGDRVCIQRIVTRRDNVFGRESFNMSDIIPKSTKVAKALYHKYGIRRNDVVYIVLPNCTDYFWPVMGAWLCHAAVSPTDPTLPTRRMVEQMEEIEPKIVFCCEASKDRVKAAVAERGLPCTVITMDGGPGEDSFEDLLRDTDKLPDVTREPSNHSDPSVILWSSGTTGRSKGILYTQRSHLGWWCAREMSPIARTLSPLLQWIIGDSVVTTHFHHISGIKLALMSGILYGTVTIVAPEDIEGPDSLFPIISLVRPTTLFMGSHHCVQLARASRPTYDVSSVSLVNPVGSYTYKGIEYDFAKNFPSTLMVANTYACSEVWVVSVAPNNDSLGSIIPDTLVRIEDPETGEILGPGKIGEIVVKPPKPVQMDGYINRPEENSKVFAKDGWIHTGDMGHFDKKGLLYYDNRLKELIKYQNCTLYPIEIEEVLMQHPSVVEAAAFGRPCLEAQELVSAFVVVEKGADVTEDEIVEFVDSQVPDHMLLRGGVKFIEELPRNPNGKVLKRKLLEIWDKDEYSLGG